MHESFTTLTTVNLNTVGYLEINLSFSTLMQQGLTVLPWSNMLFVVMKEILFAVIASHRGRPLVGGIRREKSHMY